MRNQIIYDYFYDTAYKLNAPVSVMIELLTKCNLRCEHCYLPSHDEEGLSFDTVKRILYELKDMGVVNVSFTGGEILIRKDLIDIVSIARELKMRVFLLSNGTLLNNEIAKQLAKLYISEFSTTIFSLDKNIHDSITGKEGSLVKLLNGLKLLEESSIRVRLKTPLMKKNMHCFKEIAEFCEKKGYEYLTSPLIFSKNNGDTSPKNLRIKESELCFIMRDLDILNRNDHLHKKDVPCAALLYSFAIDSKGDVHPCNSFL